jgi:hypothetical protein
MPDGSFPKSKRISVLAEVNKRKAQRRVNSSYRNFVVKSALAARFL